MRTPADVVLIEYIRLLLPLQTDPASSSASASMDHTSAASAGSSAGASTVVASDDTDSLADARLAYRERIIGVLDDIVNKAALLKALSDECLPRLAPTDYDGGRSVVTPRLGALRH